VTGGGDDSGVARSPRSITLGRRFALLALGVVGLPLLAACGQTPPPVPATVPMTPGDATIVDTPPGPGSPVAVPVGVGTPGGTVGGGEALTLGQMVETMDAAWPGVQSYRVVFVSGPAELLGSALAASPVASPAAGAVRTYEILEVVEPDRRRRVIPEYQFEGEGGVRVGRLPAEAIAVGGRVFVRGSLAELVRPGTGIGLGTWVEIDPTKLDPNSPAGQELVGLARPLPPPTAAIPANLLPQEVRPQGEIVIAGRTCQAYSAAGTTLTGGRQDLLVAIDEQGLPCLFETRSGGIVSRTIYEGFNLPLAIEPPAGAVAVVLASPVPGTPVGRD
jgi:hypothetical protein